MIIDRNAYDDTATSVHRSEKKSVNVAEPQNPRLRESRIESSPQIDRVAST